MTIPREIYVEEIETNHLCGMYSNTEYSNLPHKYYSQAVLDEKDARIKQLEDALRFYADTSKRGLKKMGTFNGADVYGDELLLDNGKIAQEALAGKGGSDE